MTYRNILLFQEACDAEIEEVVAVCRRLSLADGERLIEAGSANRTLYLLARGRMQAHLSGDLSQDGMPIAEGETIGEMSLLDGQPTSANVHALGACELLALSEADFWRVLAPLPGVMRNLTRLVTQRLRMNSERMLRSIEERLNYEHLKKDLAAARDIQLGLLPARAMHFAQFPQVDVQAHLTPAKEVGGDLFDAFAIDDEHLLVAVGDVSGKGMPAALFMMRTLTLLRAQGHRKRPSEQLMPNLNRLLNEGNDANMFVTLCVAIFAPRSGELVLFNGGHPPALLSRQGGPFEPALGAKGALLGIFPDLPYQCLRLTLAPGDRLVLYSDGVTEAENPERAMYGLERAQQALDAHADHADTHGLVQSLCTGIAEFAAGAEQSDDITILALRYHAHNPADAGQTSVATTIR